MPGNTVERDLALRLEALRKDVGDTVPVEQVGVIVRSLLAGLAAPPDDAEFKLFHELDALARYINEAKREIASLRPQDIQREYIAAATDELDAIVDATEVATNNILDATEKLENLVADVTPDVAEKLTEVSTLIYESCNFQDITGQRITKVVKTLKHIEEKIAALVAAFGPEIERAEEERAAQARAQQAQRPLTEEDLLNGPQLPGKGTKQDEVDALLASFD